MQPVKLYDLGRELVELEGLLEETGGELSDEELDRYLALQDDEARKVDQLCDWIATLDSDVEYAKAQVLALEVIVANEKKRWQAQADRKTLTSARVQHRLKVHFQTVRNGEALTTPSGRTIKLAKAGGKRAVTFPVEWEQDPARAPEGFHRRKIELDKAAIRAAVEERDAALEAAKDVKDVIEIDAKYRDVAMVGLAPQGVRLVIK